MELIKVATNAGGRQVVSARDLHEYLEVKTLFKDWMPRMIEYGFEEGKDFSSFLGETSNGRPPKEYALTLDCAKEISMIQRSEKGRQARQYFIEIEKKFTKDIQPMSQLDIMAMSVALLQEQAKKIEEVSNRIDKIEAKQLTSGIDYYTVVGFASLNKVKITPAQANILGRKCSSRSRSMGVPKQDIHDPRYGLVGGYHEEILEFVFMQEGYL